jgi:hypothetical protein
MGVDIRILLDHQLQEATAFGQLATERPVCIVDEEVTGRWSSEQGPAP